jgi:hypothetical protein
MELFNLADFKEYCYWPVMSGWYAVIIFRSVRWYYVEKRKKRLLDQIDPDTNDFTQWRCARKNIAKIQKIK